MGYREHDQDGGNVLMIYYRLTQFKEDADASMTNEKALHHARPKQALT